MPNNSNKIKIDPERGTVKDILVNEGDVVEKEATFVYIPNGSTEKSCGSWKWT